MRSPAFASIELRRDTSLRVTENRKDTRNALHVGNLSLQDHRLLVILGVYRDAQSLDEYSAAAVPRELQQRHCSSKQAV